MLETARLHLRAVAADDVEPFLRVFGDAEVMRYVAYGRPYTRDEVETLVARIRRRFDADGFGQLAVERCADGRVIGRAGLQPVDPETWESGSLAELGEGAEIEIGWTFERDAWGRGFGFEAAVAVRDWARDELGFERLVSIIQLGNEASVRLARKLGAVPERDIITSFGKQAQLFALAR